MTQPPTPTQSPTPNPSPTPAPAQPAAPRVSVVLPARDEEGCIEAVLEGVHAALAALPHEVLVVDDGSRDGTAARVAALRARHPTLRLLRHDRPAGQSAALRSGVLAARAPLVAMLDADGQNPPEELLRVLAPFLAADPDPRLGLVQGQRVGRRDTASRRLASRLANRLRAALLGDGLRDGACGLRAIPREVWLALPYFDHMHRFLPALVRREGLAVLALDVAHAPRLAGRSKYGNLRRAIEGAVDLLGVAWLLRRRRLAAAREEDALPGSLPSALPSALPAAAPPRPTEAARPAPRLGELPPTPLFPG